MNNAGVIQTGPLVDFAESDWDRIFAVNVKGIFLLSQAALPHLKVNGGLDHQHRIRGGQDVDSPRWAPTARQNLRRLA